MSSSRRAGSNGNRERFATTQWSLVLAAGASGSPEGEAALERLCSCYWYPIYAFVRRWGYSAEDAKDLTQGFFTRLIEKGDLGDANRSRGRFRSFLLAACQHFLANEHDRAAAIKRGGGRAPVPIDAVAADGRYVDSLVNLETPESLYERQWCLTLLTSVLDRLREEYVEAKNEQVFDRLRGFLTLDGDAGTHADAARDLGMTEGAVKVAVHRLRRRYRAALRRHIADTVASEQDIDDEMRHLLRALTPSRDV